MKNFKLEMYTVIAMLIGLGVMGLPTFAFALDLTVGIGALIPVKVMQILETVFAWLSGIIAVATALVAAFPSPKAEGILATLRKIASFLSGNVLNNK
jgi:hypothetical protein